MFAVFQPPRLDLQHLLPAITLTSFFFFLSSSSFSFPPSANYATSGSLHMNATLLRNRFRSIRTHLTRCIGSRSFQKESVNRIGEFMDVRRQEDRVVLASEPQTEGTNRPATSRSKGCLANCQEDSSSALGIETAQPPHTSRPTSDSVYVVVSCDATSTLPCW